MADRLTEDTFFRGLFSALALRGVHVISVRDDRFDRAVRDVFESLMSRADAADLNVRFRINPHPIHGDAGLVRDSIAAAAQRGLVSLDNPEYLDLRLRINKPLALRYLSDIPGDETLYLDLADEFMNRYYEHEIAEPKEPKTPSSASTS